MKTKVCAIILSYGEVPKLREVVKSVETLPTYVLNPVRSWWSDDMKDYTKERLEGLDVTVLNADLPNETAARNYMIEFAKDSGYDYFVMLDADEVLEGLDVLLELFGQPLEKADSYVCRIIDYGKDGVTPLPQRSHRPIMVVNTTINTEEHYFYDKRCFHGERRELPQTIAIHHYSFLTPKEFQYKIDSPLYDDSFPPEEFKGII